MSFFKNRNQSHLMVFRWWVIEEVDCIWNVMAHAQKPDFVIRRNGRVHLNRRGSQFSRLLPADFCASAVGMLETPWSEVVWRVLATHYIRQFTLYFPFRASPCAITFQLECTYVYGDQTKADKVGVECRKTWGNKNCGHILVGKHESDSGVHGRKTSRRILTFRHRASSI